MSLTINGLPTRRYAHPFDRPIKGESESYGVGRSPDAIGGYFGVGWYQTFRDHRTDVIFQVRCSDGVNGGKGAHSDEDLDWMESCRLNIIKRTKREASASGCASVYISSAEWAIMLNHTFGLWLDPLPGETYKTVGDANRHLTHGQIGTINGVHVIVDPNLDCELSPPSDQKRELEVMRARIADEHAGIDRLEEMAEALGF